MQERTRDLILAVGGLLCLAAPLLTHLGLGLGALLLLPAAPLVVVGGWGRLIRLEKERPVPPGGVELALLLGALLLTGWSCFSFIDRLEGIHFDVAEYSTEVLLRLQILGIPDAPVARLVKETLHPTLGALIVQRLGFGLWQLRLMGALACFLGMPLAYAAGRLWFGRGGGALAAATYSGSLWCFTLSKVATWDAPVPTTAAAAVVLTYGLLHRRLGWLGLPLLIAVLLYGLNLYEAFRVILPVPVLLALLALIRDRRTWWRALLVPTGAVAALLIQARAVDPLFWVRITESQLVQDRTLKRVATYLWQMLAAGLGDLHDIYLSSSQTSLDHPLMLALMLMGFFLLLGNLRGSGAQALLVWLAVPLSAAVVFEGQWRRGSAAMPALYILASLPWLVLAERLIARGSHRRGWGVTASLVGVVVLIAVARFPSIQRNRWGGYYKGERELAIATTLLRECREIPCTLVAEGGQGDVFWGFLGRLQGSGQDCFRTGETVLMPFGDQGEQIRVLLDRYDREGAGEAYLALQIMPGTDWVQQRLEAMVQEEPPRALPVPMPGQRESHRLYRLGN